MSHTKHDAIVITTWDPPLIKSAQRKAKKLGLPVTNICRSSINGYYTICVCPDGSKEGWDESEAGDKGRAELVAWMKTHAYEDGSNRLQWVHIEYYEVTEEKRSNGRVVRS